MLQPAGLFSSGQNTGLSGRQYSAGNVSAEALIFYTMSKYRQKVSSNHVECWKK